MAIRLFEPLQLRGVELQNRIVVEPMTQFSANAGVAGDWHLMHLGQFAVSGAALVFTESTYVAPEARNAPECLSLYTYEQESALARIIGFFHRSSPAKFGVQLCHGGRKASSRPNWVGGGPLSISEGGYETVAPSPVPIKEGWPVPRPIAYGEIPRIVEMFRSAASRAHNAGADVLELHGAHGYLIHQFLSPISNRRTDGYGGSVANRMRFGLEVFEAVRALWPHDKPLGIRVSATDWAGGGWTLEDTIAFARRLDALGCDFMDVSSGGLTPDQKVETGPGYQTGFAAAIKAQVGMRIITVGGISSPHQAESILRTGQADMVGLARPILYNPRWPWMAAEELGAAAFYPPQYERAQPSKWRSPIAVLPGNVLEAEPATSPAAPNRVQLVGVDRFSLAGRKIASDAR
jgi:2,4-dienoyl-CoA reductase-like NADH-dependent reductase (Old Yellow Enzyme family)